MPTYEVRIAGCVTVEAADEDAAAREVAGLLMGLEEVDIESVELIEGEERSDEPEAPAP